jgi:ribose 5-phosphate isomerase A
VSDADTHKRAAGERAADWVEAGMAVGLGTGSTAIWATRRIAERFHAGELPGLRCVPTSRQTADAAAALRLPLLADDGPWHLDITIDGADEVDPQLDLVKGGGGALTREKIVARATTRLVIVVDEAKLADALGTTWAVPVEVVTFGWRTTAAVLAGLGAEPVLRLGPDGSPFVTDQGCRILDCRFGAISDPPALAGALANVTGIVEHGLFVGLVSDLLVAGPGGVRHLRRPA